MRCMHSRASVDPTTPRKPPGSSWSKPSASRRTTSGEPDLGLASADWPLDGTIPLDRDPHAQRRRASLGIERLHRSAGDDRLADEDGRAELHPDPREGRRLPGPRDDARREVAEGEHAVGDDPGEARRARRLVVLVQRVLVSGGVGVGPDVLARDDPPKGGELLPRRHVLEPSRHAPARTMSVLLPTTTVRPASSRRSVRRRRISRPPFERMSSIVASATTRSPTVKGWPHSYSCSPCSTRERSSPSSGSARTLASPAAISGMVTMVGGTSSVGCPIAVVNAPTRSASRRNSTSGYRFPAIAGFSGTCPPPDERPTRASHPRRSAVRPIHTSAARCERSGRDAARQPPELP